MWTGSGLQASPLANPRHPKPSGIQGSSPSAVLGLPPTPQGPKPSGVPGLSPIPQGGPSPSPRARSVLPGDSLGDPGFAVNIETEPFWEVDAGGPSSQGGALGDKTLGDGTLGCQTLSSGGALGGHAVPLEIEGMPIGPGGTGGGGLGGTHLGFLPGFVGPSGSGAEGGFDGTQGPGVGTNPTQTGSEGGFAGAQGSGAGANPTRKGGARPRDAAGFRSPANRGAGGTGGAGGKGKDARRVHITNVQYIGMSEQRLVVEKMGKGPGKSV